MIRLLLIVLVALLIGTALSLGLQYDLGYIRISLGNYLVETNFWVGLFVLAALVALILVTVALIRRLGRSTGFVTGWLARGNERRARRRTTQGLLALAEGNWPRARKLLEASAGHADTPLINYLAAAQAAFESGDHEAVDTCCAGLSKVPPARIWRWASPRPSCKWPVTAWNRPWPR